MEDYFNQISLAAESGLYFLALSGALVIPDICSGMEAQDGITDGNLYKAWVNQYLSHHYVVGVDNTPNFSGEDCWGLRCSFLHQGRLAPHGGAYSRVIFVEPVPGRTFHNNVINDALNIDVPIFVSTMIEAAKDWLSKVGETEEYKANFPHFLHRYPNGLPPYIVGVPIIG